MYSRSLCKQFPDIYREGESPVGSPGVFHKGKNELLVCVSYCLWPKISVSTNFWNSTSLNQKISCSYSLCSVSSWTSCLYYIQYKEEQTCSEQSFIKWEYSLFTQTTIQTGRLLKNYFRERPPGLIGNSMIRKLHHILRGAPLINQWGFKLW